MKQWDAESVKQRLITNLQSKSEWSEIIIDGTNQKLLDTFAEQISELARYNEYLLGEAKWSVARNTSSLLTEAKVLSYEPHRLVGAKSGASVFEVSYSETFNGAPPVNITIPKYSMFSGGGLLFSNLATEQITTLDTSIFISIIQGFPRSVPTYIATGIISEEIDIVNEKIEDDEIIVLVNSVEWTQATNNDLRNHGSTELVYTITNKVDFSGIYITFGDGIFGRKLSSGDQVNITYIETEGLDGNLLTLNTLDTVESVIRDANDDVVDIYCRNVGSIIGGLSVEGKESIRSNAPPLFQTGDRAVSNVDYEIIIVNDYDYVAKSNVWGAKEINEDLGNDPWTYIPATENLVQIVAVTTNKEDLSLAQKLEITEGLNPRKSPTDILQFNNNVFIRFLFTIDAYVKDRSYTLSQVKANILSDLNTEYSFENLDYFQTIFSSDYTALIDSSSGVDHHITTFQVKVLESFNSAYVTDVALSLSPVTVSTIEVYVKLTVDDDLTYVLIGTDDGAGFFTAEAGYSLTGSTVNYTTGAMAINVASGLSGPYADYTVKVLYKSVSTNIVLSARNQFPKFDDTDTTINVSYF